ncbi:hypothetical protein SORBI_3006G258200 [Sorghum bicolor]|uniref:Uncharacterized protein n=1 Tax=Sorghum bicolor TaxID=4558 RepID=A0A1B6PNZ8_SORBI|nr:hypothetical protein SORBI_3006G258200 [Sorghum bicolor]
MRRPCWDRLMGWRRLARPREHRPRPGWAPTPTRLAPPSSTWRRSRRSRRRRRMLPRPRRRRAREHGPWQKLGVLLAPVTVISYGRVRQCQVLRSCCGGDGSEAISGGFYTRAIGYFRAAHWDRFALACPELRHVAVLAR